jgi:hypothetical protein
MSFGRMRFPIASPPLPHELDMPFGQGGELLSSITSGGLRRVTRSVLHRANLAAKSSSRRVNGPAGLAPVELRGSSVTGFSPSTLGIVTYGTDKLVMMCASLWVRGLSQAGV